MKVLIVRWFILTVAILVAAHAVPGFRVPALLTGIVLAVVLSLINAVIRPILLLLTLPVNILSLGLFTLVINGLMLWLAGSLVRGVQIAGFSSAFLAALVISLVGVLINWLVRDRDE